MPRLVKKLYNIALFNVASLLERNSLQYLGQRASILADAIHKTPNIYAVVQGRRLRLLPAAIFSDLEKVLEPHCRVAHIAAESERAPPPSQLDSTWITRRSVGEQLIRKMQLDTNEQNVKKRRSSAEPSTELGGKRGPQLSRPSWLV